MSAEISSGSKIVPDFFKDLKYTNNLLPRRENSTLLKVAKWAVIILSLGLIFIIPLTMDYSIKISNKIFGREKPLIMGEISSLNTQQLGSANIVPAQITSQRILHFLTTICTIGNAKKTAKSVWEGITLLPRKATEIFAREDTDTYKKICLAISITAPFWLAGGFVRGSLVSALYNGGGYGLIKLHEKLITPPEDLQAR